MDCQLFGASQGLLAGSTVIIITITIIMNVINMIIIIRVIISNTAVIVVIVVINVVWQAEFWQNCAVCAQSKSQGRVQPRSPAERAERYSEKVKGHTEDCRDGHRDLAVESEMVRSDGYNSSSR
jgi:hypothetical protein